MILKKQIKTYALIIVSLFSFTRIDNVKGITPAQLNAFNFRLDSTMCTHLDYLINNNLITSLGADGMMAFAYYLTYERKGTQSYRTAALQLTDQILAEMKNTPHGVIKIKEVSGVDYGAPPDFGLMTAYAGYILYKEVNKPDRDADLLYIANVVNNYYWYGDLYPGQDWWAGDVQVLNGLPDPNEDPTKPTPLNKNASMFKASAMLSSFVSVLDPTLSANLKNKADACINNEIIPVQEPDGFFHYNLNGNDPNGKDVLGYFMIATSFFTQAKRFTPYYNTPPFDSLLTHAYNFALSDIASITAPNSGVASVWATDSTPSSYSTSGEIKRGFQLGVSLFAARYYDEGVPIIDLWMQSYPNTSTDSEGAHASCNSALILFLIQQDNFTTSLENNDKNVTNFSFFPNPTSNYIKLNKEDECDLLIYDLSGQLLLSKRTLPKETIDVSFLSKGAYFITIKDNETLKIEKLIVSN